MQRLRWLILAFVVTAVPAGAQPAAPSQELVALLPKDFSLCLVINDLRGHWQHLEQADWVRKLKQSPIGQTLATAPEFRDLARFAADLKKHLDVDWPTLRDEVLGDAMVFAYRAPRPTGREQGLFLVKARRAEALARLVDRLNELQTKAGELKSLEPRQFQGVTYYRREHARNTFFYSLHGPVLAVASSEDTLKAVIHRPVESPVENAPVSRALRRAGAERAWAAFWLNPRDFDDELAAKAPVKDLGPESRVLAQFMTYWKALDGVVLAVDRIDDDIEVRLSLLADAGALSGAAKDWFTRRGQASELWRRFPANSIFTLAGRTDFRALADGLLELAPPDFRKAAVHAVSKNVAAAVGLDPFRDVLPNLGPDWGMCILPAKEGKQFPQAIFALAVKPGTKDTPVDQALVQALHFVARLAVFEHNRTHADPIQMRTVRQGDVAVTYLVQDRLFPPGFQPACALKDGYLLLATSPAAIELFQKPATVAAADGDVPLMRFAPSELAQLARHHRERVLEQIALKSGSGKTAASEHLDNLLILLDLCRHITLSQRNGDGRLTWIVRFGMVSGKTP